MKEKYFIEIILMDDSKISLCLETKYAKETTQNFINLIKERYYDGTIFHRIIDNFMIQTGGYIVKDNRLIEMEARKPIKGEFASNGHQENSLKHQLGVISMARTSDKNSATTQFFICAADCPWLDGEYAAFGYCINQASLDAVIALSKVETGTLGYGFSDFPKEIIQIKTINLVGEE